MDQKQLFFKALGEAGPCYAVVIMSPAVTFSGEPKGFLLENHQRTQ
jgi:hypothetical protein